jgi:hypothetical protein
VSENSHKEVMAAGVPVKQNAPSGASVKSIPASQ